MIVEVYIVVSCLEQMAGFVGLQVFKETLIWLRWEMYIPRRCILELMLMVTEVAGEEAGEL